MAHALTAHHVRYPALMYGSGGQSASEVAARLMEKLPRLWDLSYREMTGSGAPILELRLEGVVYRLDRTLGQGGEGTVVVAYGFSTTPAEPREGAALDLHLLPLRREANSGHPGGWSTRGTAFREMDEWCAEHPGTFFFARPIYLDGSREPRAMEYGVLRSPGDLWVERFPVQAQAAADAQKAQG